MMNKKALDLLRKYIDLQIALEFKSEQAAVGDYYDESIPWTSNEIEETWKAFVDALGRPSGELIEVLIELAEIVYALADEARFSSGWEAAEVLSRLKALKENEDETG